MNIFVLDTDPRTCARYHCDKHVIKMILESAQLLCTARRMYNEEAPYKATHVNHPCSKWVRESKANYIWLFTLMHHLNDEYRSRYQKTRNHLSYEKMIPYHTPPLKMPGTHLTPWRQCMPTQYHCDKVVEAYRTYYIHEKNRFAKWTCVDNPPWWNNSQDWNVNG